MRLGVNVEQRALVSRLRQLGPGEARALPLQGDFLLKSEQ
jgi:hypothetical protein